jgi:pSer/pThr/pTyr-binding forkhead associated (FHA) protein
VAAGAAPPPWVTATGSIRGDGDPTRTMVYRHPAPAPPRAILREVRRDGGERTIEVGAGILELGRAKDCEIVLDDPRASRRHGRLQARRGALVYTDLGSTNGSRVNGIRVDEIALGFGDRLQIGDTVLVVENLPG